MSVEFAITGVSQVDDILAVVDHASNGVHNSDEWNSEPVGDAPYSEQIFERAKIAADEILRLRQELAEAEARGRNKGLEEAAALADERAHAIMHGVFPDYLAAVAEGGANCARWIAKHTRALITKPTDSEGV